VHLCVNYLEEGVRQLLEGRQGLFESDRPDALLEGRYRFSENGKLDTEDSAKMLCALLNRYCNEIELFNPAYGLVSVKDRVELAVKHILDSLAPLGIIKQLISGCRFPRIADVGSGAGFPGIPLALALPDVSFTLIERMGRRAGFLRNTAAVLPLPNVEVLESTAEQAPPEIADIVCFRALRPLEPKILRVLFRLLKPGAWLAAYKGRRETILTEISPLSLTQQNAEWRVIPCRVPFLDDERNLLLIKKR
jgi:16S rRNA (guanine527-N7)-methyltransferase